MSVAPPAGVRQILEFCLAAMLFSNHMIDLVREEAYLAGQQTEFTAVSCPFDDLTSQSCGDSGDAHDACAK